MSHDHRPKKKKNPKQKQNKTKINVFYHNNKEQIYNHLNKSREKSDKIQHLFMTNTLTKLGTDDNFFI